MITHARLLELLSYDAETGIFRYRQQRGRMKPGDVAGAVKPDNGYRQIAVDGRLYYAHRLAWFYVTGAWPKNEIDHRDSEHDHNAFANLREATREENSRYQAKPTRNKTGIRGVYFEPRTGRYYAQVRKGAGHTQVHLGTFDTLEEAARARRDAVQRIHGEFASPLDRP